MGEGRTLHLTTKGDREIVMTRKFDAPRALVWDCFTRPELVRRWLFGPDGWSFVVCDIDLRTGGEATSTVELTEERGRTTVTQTVRYASREARDIVLESGMKEGMEMGYKRLANLMAAFVEAGTR